MSQPGWCSEAAHSKVSGRWKKMPDHLSSSSVSLGLICPPEGAWGRQILWGKAMIHLKTNRRFFKSTRKQTGSQWNDTKTGVMCSCFLVPVKRRAAVFWTSCSRDYSVWLIREYSTLQWSKLAVIKAWIKISKRCRERNGLKWSVWSVGQRKVKTDCCKT